MTEYKDSAFKDSSPTATVARIKEILARHGIHTTEVWQESSVPYCHAMSVSVNGTSLKSNGKGITPEFALASGYGELMERMQIGVTGSSEIQKVIMHADSINKYKFPANTLWHRNRRWYELWSEKLTACTGTDMPPEAILGRFTGQDGLVNIREYIRLGTDQIEALPDELVQRIYCTNGCAAGNTPEEAMVQAISEIMERHHQMRILHEDLTPPDIPEEDLRKCKAASASIAFLRENGFHVSVKDCSFGTPFPVVCVCLIDEKTGRYHTHFGAFPVFEIALERALTESFQGRTLQTVAQYHQFSSKKAGQHSLCAVGNEVFFGSWEKTRNFFTGTPSYAYNPNMGFDASDNKHLLRQCVDYLKDNGHDILVRDHSALGFPTYQVLIPGISEVMIHRLSPNLDDTRYSMGAAKCLRRPAKATASDAMSLIMHLQLLDQFGSKIRSLRDFAFCARLPMKLDGKSNEILMLGTLCHINYTMGRMGEVIKGIDKLLTQTNGETAGRLICLRRYLTMKSEGCDQQAIHALLAAFQPEAEGWLNKCITENLNPFAEFILDCNLVNCNSCAFVSSCCYRQNKALSALIAQKTQELDYDKFIEFMESL